LRIAAGPGHKVEILAADLTDFNDLAGVEFWRTGLTKQCSGLKKIPMDASPN
jgi:hypothetical protein